MESNARLTGSTAIVLVILLAAEGITILQVRQLLTWHVFIGMLLVPVVVLKIGSTGWRFVRYYRGASAYRRKGPPAPLLRILGPFVIVLTVVVFASGIVLLLGPQAWHSQLLFLHKASFVLWFGATAIHVIGHVRETAQVGPQDWMRRTRRDVAGAGLRQWGLAASLVVGVLLAILVAGHVGHYLPGLDHRRG